MQLQHDIPSCAKPRIEERIIDHPRNGNVKDALLHNMFVLTIDRVYPSCFKLIRCILLDGGRSDPLALPSNGACGR